jgi:hypothetical protein
MRNRSWDQYRDLVVRLLARLSLVVVLAVLGALFVGTAATSQAASGPETGTTMVAEQRIRPVGFLVGGAVIGGGLVVLLFGAFRPPPSSERRERGHALNR